MIFGLLLIAYTTASIVWFMLVMGYKFRKAKWYDYLLCWPVALIAVIVGALTRNR